MRSICQTVEPSTQLLIDILVQDILTCDICSVRMCLSPIHHVPKNLDCTHTFCVSCLDKLKTGMGMFSTIICPKCHIETTLGISGVLGLKNNHTVISVINILEAFNAVNCTLCHVKPATLQCYSCGEVSTICESCHTTEGSLHAYHDVRPLDLRSVLQSTGQLRVKSSDDEEVIVQCPRSIVGKVLSSPRNSFEKIRSDTQCSVDVRKLSDRESPAHITIRGPKQSIKMAQSMVEEIMDSVVLQNQNPHQQQHQQHHHHHSNNPHHHSHRQHHENLKGGGGGGGGGNGDDHEQEQQDRNEYTIDMTYYEAIDIFELRYNIVQNISTQTNTDIKLVPYSQDERMRVVVIRPAVGATTSCRTDIARKLILKMIEETDIDREKRSRRPSLSDPVSEVSEVVVLSTLQYHKLASSSFAPLQRIAQRVGCRIDAREENQTGVVILNGSIIQVREAKQLLKHVLDNRPHSFTPTTIPPGFNVLPNSNTLPSNTNLTPPRNFLLEHNNYGTPTSFNGHDDRKRPQSFTHFPPSSASPSATSSSSSSSSSSTTTTSTTSAGILLDKDRSPLRATTTTATANSSTNHVSFRESQFVSSQIICEYDSIGKLVGVRGGRLEELRTLTDCQIIIKKGDTNVSCIIEVIGAPDKVAYAVPMIKMVLGSGDAVMTSFRSQHQHPHPHHPSDSNNLPLKIQEPIPISRRLALSPMQLSNPLEKHAEEEHEASTPSTSHNNSKDDLLKTHTQVGDQTTSTTMNTSSTAVSYDEKTTFDPNLIVPDEYVSDNDDADTQEPGSPTLPKSKTVLAAQKYNISPPPTPPPSKLFPEYFIQVRNSNLIEKITYHQTNISNSRLQEIALFSRCKITFLESNPMKPDQITIQLQGLPDQRELAKLLIEATVKPNQFRSPGVIQKDGLDGVVRTMDCPPHFISVLIGPGGETIESIQTQSGTKILINENVDEDRPPTLSIIGTTAGVDIAVQILDRLVMNHRFKYRQASPMLTESSRAKSLPIMSRTNESVLSTLDNEEYDDEYQEEIDQDGHHNNNNHNDDDDYEPEEGGRTLLTPSPLPMNQSVGALTLMANQKRMQGLVRNNQTSNTLHHQNSISQLSTVSDTSAISSLDFSRSSSTVSNGTINQGSNWSTPVSSPIRSVMSSDSQMKYMNLASPRDLTQYTLETTIYCPMDKVAQVIGKRGSILRELKRLSNCEIIVNQEPLPGDTFSPTPTKGGKHKKPQSQSQQQERSPPPTPSGKSTNDNLKDMPPQAIKILGTLQNEIDKAKELILAVVELGPVVALGMETIKMDCPADKVPLVIGIKGMTAKEMMRRTGCKIHVNETAPEGTTMCSIELTGTTEQIEQATKIISHVLEFGTKALGKRFQRSFQKGDGDLTPNESLDETSL